MFNYTEVKFKIFNDKYLFLGKLMGENIWLTFEDYKVLQIFYTSKMKLIFNIFFKKFNFQHL